VSAKLMNVNVNVNMKSERHCSSLLSSDVPRKDLSLGLLAETL